MLDNGSYTYAYFFWILSTIKIKFGQILISCMTNMLLGECWRLETSSRLFYDFNKMTIQRDLAIFNGRHLPFLIVPYPPFQKNETPESWHIWLLNNWGQVAKLTMTWNLAPVLQIVQKITESYFPSLYLSFGYVWWLHELWFKRYVQKYTLFHVLIFIVTSQIW